MEGNNRPLALNSWVDMSGPNSYLAAIEAVDAAFAAERDPDTGKHAPLTSFIISALCDRIASQSMENYEQYSTVRSHLTEQDKDYIQGNKRPSELVAFLESIPDLSSIEIARRTLHSSTDTAHNVIDTPVLADLDGAEELATTAHRSRPLYRIKNLNPADAVDQHYIQVDRKQVVRQHFGSHVLTIVRNSLVLHNDNHSLPHDIRKIIRDERERARTAKRYDYDRHFEDLSTHIEPVMDSASDKSMPSWLEHVLTTYYSVKSDYIVDENLKSFADKS